MLGIEISESNRRPYSPRGVRSYGPTVGVDQNSRRYDIADYRRRARVASDMENFGRRVQYSVFECHLSEAEISDLETRLQAIIDWDRDRVRYYPLCERDARPIVMDRPGEVSRDWDYLIV